ncbi:hypothetical protein LWI29_002333 [Acer saccharum]|uniref:Uncharacterized protein n=1 Tax=Acer saccharum TaxID=4024 RepID=A0AA39VMI1_ACESA|nr:hypothetical protein LWI29_002333 [Acer saccharum]
MPIYSSSSDSEPETTPVTKLFGRKRPVHAVLGGGKVLLSIETLPFLYDRYEKEVDRLVYKAMRRVRKMFHSFDSQVLNKIPRGGASKDKTSSADSNAYYGGGCGAGCGVGCGGGCGA